MFSEAPTKPNAWQNPGYRSVLTRFSGHSTRCLICPRSAREPVNGLIQSLSGSVCREEWDHSFILSAVVF